MRSAFRSCLAAAGLTAAAIVPFQHTQEKRNVYCAALQQPKTKQQVFMWGRKDAFPGGNSINSTGNTAGNTTGNNTGNASGNTRVNTITANAQDDDIRGPTAVKFFEENQFKWKTFVFGPHFGVALAGNGDVYMWGSIRPTSEREIRQRLPTVYVLPFKLNCSGLKIDQIQCTRDKIYLLTNDGRVYVHANANGILQQQAGVTTTATVSQQQKLNGTGSGTAAVPHEGGNGNGSTGGSKQQVCVQVQGLPVPSMLLLQYNKVTQISAGHDHICFLTLNGEVYCSGDNTFGQCGIQPEEDEGQEVDNYVALNKLTFSEPHTKIKSISCGGRHTIALDTAGNAYAWGDDHKIQLNIGDTRTSSPVLVGSTWKEQLEKGYVGKNNALAAYGFYHRHLQHQPIKTIHPPQRDRPVPYPPASKVACGEDFSVFVHRDSPDWWEKVRETNALMCCGENVMGQCGRSLNHQQQTQMPVRLPRGHFTELLACGNSHCLSVLRNGTLYGWGNNKHGQVGTGPRGSVNPPRKVYLDGQPAREEQTPETVIIPGQPAPIPTPTPPTNEQKTDTNTPGGKITYVNCGFDNSVVVREVPV
eukprot:GDKI01025201.1.p1 GENE.GDKI01025201.1~~GDKI01025201.1.p1  ORF type:complete len:600 (-),score=117.72 GDKI01025201.1:113-1873(-)